MDYYCPDSVDEAIALLAPTIANALAGRLGEFSAAVNKKIMADKINEQFTTARRAGIQSRENQRRLPAH